MGCHPARSLIVAIAVLTCTLFIYPSDVRSYINLIPFFVQIISIHSIGEKPRTIQTRCESDRRIYSQALAANGASERSTTARNSEWRDNERKTIELSAPLLV